MKMSSNEKTIWIIIGIFVFAIIVVTFAVNEIFSINKIPDPPNYVTITVEIFVGIGVAVAVYIITKKDQKKMNDIVTTIENIVSKQFQIISQNKESDSDRKEFALKELIKNCDEVSGLLNVIEQLDKAKKNNDTSKWPNIERDYAVLKSSILKDMSNFQWIASTYADVLQQIDVSEILEVASQGTTYCGEYKPGIIPQTLENLKHEMSQLRSRFQPQLK